MIKKKKVPDTHPKWREKPARYPSHLLGHEGEGSALSLLKKQGLATELCAGLAVDEAGVSILAIEVHLTDEAMKNPEAVRLVGETIFSSVELLKREGIPDWVHTEVQTIDEMNFRFRSLTDPMNAVLSLYL